MHLDTDETLPIHGGRKFLGSTPIEFVIASYLCPRHCTSIRSTFGYVERFFSNKVARTFNLHELKDKAKDESEHSEEISPNKSVETPSIQSWVEQMSQRNSIINRRANRFSTFRSEFSQYILQFTVRRFTLNDCLQY